MGFFTHLFPRIRKPENTGQGKPVFCHILQNESLTQVHNQPLRAISS